MFRLSQSTVLISYIWVATLLLLFCDFATGQETSNSPLLISKFKQTDEKVIINEQPQNLNLYLTAELRTKKVTLSSQEKVDSIKPFLVNGWNKSLSSRALTNSILDNSLKPAYLWLDKPPPSTPIQ
jgi:hypothetical protein